MLVEEKIKENVLLSPYTTLGIGGPAKYFITADTKETVFAAIKWAKKEKISLFLLGGGSNVVIADEGFSGLVLQINNQGLETRFQDDRVLVKVAAGTSWDEFVCLSVKNNWAGIECLSGIPGKIGATPIQNVGAYGQEVKDTIFELTAYDIQEEKLVTFSSQECQFSYRHSIFKSSLKDNFVILDVTYSLSLNGLPNIIYPELKKHILEKSFHPTLLETREAVIELRRKKSMVIDPLDLDSKSVGSFFTNPIIEQTHLMRLKEKLQNKEVNETIPQFSASLGKVKLSAAWLIEKAGFKKGYQKGDVAISSKHALALINKNNGTAKEICLLAKEIQEKVKETFDIYLEPEPIYVGFEK